MLLYCDMKNAPCIRKEADKEQISNCKNSINKLDASLDHLSNALSLASNNVRFKILFLLYKEKKLCVCDLSEIIGMNVSAISQHLWKLKR